MWLSSVYGPQLPVCTPDNVRWCPGGSPPRPGSGRQWLPGQSVALLGCDGRTRYITSQWFSIKIQVWGTWGPVNGINGSIIQELPTHSGYLRPNIVLHQEEPRAHCTSVRSDNGSEDFILVPPDMTPVQSWFHQNRKSWYFMIQSFLYCNVSNYIWIRTCSELMTQEDWWHWCCQEGMLHLHNKPYVTTTKRPYYIFYI